MTAKKTSLGYLIIMFLSLCTYGQTYNNVLLKRIGSGNFNGNVLVFEDGKTVLKKSHGLANIANGDSLSLNSVFRLGSVSKQFTAMAISILSEDGKLSFNQDIRDFIPDLPYENITIRNLLEHTSGLPDYMDLMMKYWRPKYDIEDEMRYISGNEDIVQMFIEKKPKVLYDVGTKWQYSNTGYVLLASIVEIAAGIPFDEFLSKRIFNPLGMHETVVYKYKSGLDPEMPLRAFGFREKRKKKVSNDNHFLNLAYGDGGVYSTLDDLLKWDRSLYVSTLVSKPMLDVIFSRGKLTDGSSFDYGFGWFIKQSKDGNKILSHGGGWVGFATYIYRDISKNSSFIILTNNTGWQDVEALVAEFRELMSD